MCQVDIFLLNIGYHRIVDTCYDQIKFYIENDDSINYCRVCTTFIRLLCILCKLFYASLRISFLLSLYCISFYFILQNRSLHYSESITLHCILEHKAACKEEARGEQ